VVVTEADKTVARKALATFWKNEKSGGNYKQTVGDGHLTDNWRYVQGNNESHQYKMGNVGFMLNHLRYSHETLDTMFFEQAALEKLLYPERSPKGAKDIQTFRRGVAILGLQFARDNIKGNRFKAAGFEYAKATMMMPELFRQISDGKVNSHFRPARKLLSQFTQPIQQLLTNPEFQEGMKNGQEQTYASQKNHFNITAGGNHFTRKIFPSDYQRLIQP
jgi:hypothetical protein